MKPIVDLKGNVYLPDDPLVLTTGPLVGLGDHAIFTTLPRRFKELGYTVLLDRDVAARNDEILEALWHNNPHIDGATDKKPNAGYTRQGLFYEIANRYPLGSIEAMERAHGLPPPYSIAPYINYEHKGVPFDLSDKVLLDFSTVSSKIEDQGVSDFLRAMKSKYRNAPFVQLLMPKWASLEPPRVREQSIQVDSLYEYLDLLHAARAWIGSEAGGQSLAASVRGEHLASDLDARPELNVLSTPKTFNSRGYTFAGIDYRVSQFCQDKDSDFWLPHECVTHVYELRCAMSLAQMRSRAVEPSAS